MWVHVRYICTPQPLFCAEHPQLSKIPKKLAETTSFLQDGGASVTSYEVEVAEHGSPSSLLIWVTQLKVLQPSATLQGLLNDAQYEVRVSARNQIGISQPSQTITIGKRCELGFRGIV